MKYMLLLFDPENYWESVSEEEMTTALTEHQEFARYLRERGVEFSGQAVHPGQEAVTVRPSANGPQVVKEPFVELKTDFAGYYLIDCAGLDEALEIARHCPMGAGVEVRPVWEAP
ncbi:YciI family protein [Sphaerisporangium sp. TRM90804]|uniref:YciI family protein n=1 Tax=Sphaerisporangium sp. TRM90804 TaxID=3031113 RepID=UPI002446EAF8|nr:YciI family protein [Sphaerisporangium sp. TRM90804]MDH2430419.1 YciI family protein [Sphaerisporangium sp. TRM90804]